MTKRRYVRFWLTAAMVSALVAGCNTTKPAATNPEASGSAPRFGQEPVIPQPTGNGPNVTGDITKPEDSGATTVAVEPQTPPKVTPPPTDKKVETSSDTKPPASKPDSSTLQYDAKKPALMGVRLTDSKPSVKQKLGDPVSEFVMEDEKDPIDVQEYDGFSIGFNSKGFVEFIEITSKDVNPGLNGLRLGQKVKDAETALGKPDTNTTYALHYKAGGTILKLDIDKKTEAITSIKLFADRK